MIWRNIVEYFANDHESKCIKELKNDMSSLTFEILCNGVSSGNIKIGTAARPATFLTNAVRKLNMARPGTVWPSPSYGAQSHIYILPIELKDDMKEMGHNDVIFTDGSSVSFFHNLEVDSMELEEKYYWPIAHYVHALDSEQPFPLTDSELLYFNMKYR